MANKIMVTDSNFEFRNEIVTASVPLEKMIKNKHFISLVRYTLYSALFVRIQNAQINSIKESIKYYSRSDMVVVKLTAIYTQFKENNSGN